MWRWWFTIHRLSWWWAFSVYVSRRDWVTSFGQRFPLSRSQIVTFLILFCQRSQSVALEFTVPPTWHPPSRHSFVPGVWRWEIFVTTMKRNLRSKAFVIWLMSIQTELYRFVTGLHNYQYIRLFIITGFHISVWCNRQLEWTTRYSEANVYTGQ
jgi:hypothetical protein